MGAAANGSMIILGRSGKTYVCDFQSADATGTQWTFNLNGAAAATSPTQLRIPEDGVITDVSIATGTTCVGGVFSQDNATIIGGAIRYANHLNTLNQRPSLRIPLKGGSFLGLNTF